MSNERKETFSQGEGNKVIQCNRGFGTWSGFFSGSLNKHEYMCGR